MPLCSSSADVGRLDFKLQVSEDKKKTTLFVTDPLTALFEDGRQLNIRDIFSSQLQYKVTYWKNKSTGKVSKSKRSSVRLKHSRMRCLLDTLPCVVCRKCACQRAM